MKILVLSDSHSALRYMRQSIDVLKPDAVIHLGDYFDDGEALAEEYPALRFHQVPGNCDKYRCSPFAPRILNYDVGGVRLYMTHGHQHQVKSTISLLLADARKGKAQAALYGHTHVAGITACRDGQPCLNPGSLSIPKMQTPPCYIILEGRRFSMRRLCDSSEYAALEI